MDLAAAFVKPLAPWLTCITPPTNCLLPFHPEDDSGASGAGWRYCAIVLLLLFFLPPTSLAPHHHHTGPPFSTHSYCITLFSHSQYLHYSVLLCSTLRTIAFILILFDFLFYFKYNTVVLILSFLFLCSCIFEFLFLQIAPSIQEDDISSHCVLDCILLGLQ